ncbi:hypothetical protein CGCVW01_v003791 [Colletotrichum viniferum]|nr:hypothetical protein CGCVW01_v003791 [Colletotrichum viniferum]
MAALLLETRTDISDLKQSHPELANSFVSLRDKLDSSSNWAHPQLTVKEKETWEPLAQAQQRRDLESQFNEVIAKIRTNPGFEDFLLPPKTEDLLAAASLGPIVVLNASIWSCDAFIITSRSIEALRLPPFLFSNFRGSIQLTLESLEDIWMRIAKPVLDFLGFDEKPKDGEWPHVWWIPTGSLSRLPIHAAGYHSEGSSEAVIDRVISSYSTSIKALLQARRRSVRKLHDVDSHTVCLVSMSTTPSRNDFYAGSLEFAEEEVQMLDSLLSPTASTTLLHQPNKEDVLRHIESCTAFHFAGHGVTDPLDPSKSCLLLNDWVQDPLTVDDLTSLSLYERSPWLAYLSACSTGENQTERLQDESIHLASACQLAGFPHVVASSWKIDDECSAEAAAEVYRTIQEYGWTDESVALGVHNATRLLRSKRRGDGWTEQSEDIDNEESYEESYATTPPPDGEPHELEGGRGPGYAVRTGGNPMIWAAYIHVGP